MGRRNDSRTWIHAGLVLAEAICVPAFLIEINRALGGNTLSWAYVVEWPILGTYAVYVWRKLLREASGEVRNRPLAEVSPETTEELAEWNRYLDQVHGRSSDEPSGE